MTALGPATTTRSISTLSGRSSKLQRTTAFRPLYPLAQMDSDGGSLCRHRFKTRLEIICLAIQRCSQPAASAMRGRPPGRGARSRSVTSRHRTDVTRPLRSMPWKSAAGGWKVSAPTMMSRLVAVPAHAKLTEGRIQQSSLRQTSGKWHRSLVGCRVVARQCHGPKGSPSEATPLTLSSRLFEVMIPRTKMVTM
jgi:hypothetical protein